MPTRKIATHSSAPQNTLPGFNSTDLSQLLNSYKLQRDEIQVAHLQHHSHEHTLWESRAGQLKRFDLLMVLPSKCDVPLNEASLLDVGCGVGDLYGHLLRKSQAGGKFPQHYAGFDISPTFIEGCQLLYPHADFQLCNILTESVPTSYDYVVSSGVFTELITDNETYARSMITQMFKIANKGIAFNFLTLDRPTLIERRLKKWLNSAPGVRKVWADLRGQSVGQGAYAPNQLADDDEAVYYFNIDKLVEFCRTLATGAQVTYRTGYFSVDVTVYVTKPH